VGPTGQPNGLTGPTPCNPLPPPFPLPFLLSSSPSSSPSPSISLLPLPPTHSPISSHLISHLSLPFFAPRPLASSVFPHPGLPRPHPTAPRPSTSPSSSSPSRPLFIRGFLLSSPSPSSPHRRSRVRVSCFVPPPGSRDSGAR
uniref:Uncharacterized protein n=1 Tax=Oryza glumipatula TaxID=40148 RepID=A0A0D9ZTH6_9ORYZ